MSNAFCDLVGRDHLLLDLRAGDKKQLLQELATHAGAAVQRPMQAIFEALQTREALGATGLGKGFALPHARVAGLTSFFGLFARLARPVAFDAIDEKPVDLVFLLLIPAGAADGHVAQLAGIARVFRDDALMRRLRKARSVNELHAILHEAGMGAAQT